MSLTLGGVERHAIGRPESRILARHDAFARERWTHRGSLHAIFNEPERENLFEDLLEQVFGLKG